MPPNMHARPFISVIIGTARDSYGALVGSSDHQLLGSFTSLASQTDQDFEVIVADSIHDTRDLAYEISTLGKWTFPWQVVKPTSYWLTNHLWGLQGAFNTAAIASRGHCLLFCGDCFSFPPDAFAQARVHLDQGRCPQFLCWKRINGLLKDPAREPDLPFEHSGHTYATIEALDADGLYTPGRIYGDSRFSDPMMIANSCILPEHASWQWFYGYGFIRRDDFFSVNGWSELYDGDKGLGDVELGSRLEQCGRLHFYMHRNLVVYEECHKAIHFSQYHDSVQNALRSNYDLLWLHRVHNITRAHATRLPDHDLWRCIRATITGLHCWPMRSTIPDDVKQHANWWIANQPIYKLEDHCAGV